MSALSLVDRMQKLLDYYPSSDHERAEFSAILADVRELERAAYDCSGIEATKAQRERLGAILTKCAATKEST